MDTESAQSHGDEGSSQHSVQAPASLEEERDRLGFALHAASSEEHLYDSPDLEGDGRLSRSASSSPAAVRRWDIAQPLPDAELRGSDNVDLTHLYAQVSKPTRKEGVRGGGDDDASGAASAQLQDPEVRSAELEPGQECCEAEPGWKGCGVDGSGGNDGDMQSEDIVHEDSTGSLYAVVQPRRKPRVKGEDGGASRAVAGCLTAAEQLVPGSPPMPQLADSNMPLKKSQRKPHPKKAPPIKPKPYHCTVSLVTPSNGKPGPLEGKSPVPEQQATGLAGVALAVCAKEAPAPCVHPPPFPPPPPPAFSTLEPTAVLKHSAPQIPPPSHPPPLPPSCYPPATSEDEASHTYELPDGFHCAMLPDNDATPTSQHQSLRPEQKPSDHGPPALEPDSGPASVNGVDFYKQANHVYEVLPSDNPGLPRLPSNSHDVCRLDRVTKQRPAGGHLKPYGSSKLPPKATPPPPPPTARPLQLSGCVGVVKQPEPLQEGGCLPNTSYNGEWKVSFLCVYGCA